VVRTREKRYSRGTDRPEGQLEGKKKKTEKGDIIEIMEKTRHQAQDRKKMIHQLQPETEMGGTNEQVKLKKTST